MAESPNDKPLRIEFREDREYAYTDVILNGRVLAVFHDEHRQSSLIKIVEEAYRRGAADATAVLRHDLRQLIGAAAS